MNYLIILLIMLLVPLSNEITYFRKGMSCTRSPNEKDTSIMKKTVAGFWNHNHTKYDKYIWKWNMMKSKWQINNEPKLEASWPTWWRNGSKVSRAFATAITQAVLTKPVNVQNEENVHSATILFLNENVLIYIQFKKTKYICTVLLRSISVKLN